MAEGGPRHRLQTASQGVHRTIRGRRPRAPIPKSRRKQRVSRDTQMQRPTKGKIQVPSSWKSQEYSSMKCCKSLIYIINVIVVVGSHLGRRCEAGPRSDQCATGLHLSEGVRGSEGKYRSSVDARESQNPTKSEEYQKYLQGVLYIV
eukprot:7893421-Pyramimonas_sp.AAC.1